MKNEHGAPIEAPRVFSDVRYRTDAASGLSFDDQAARVAESVDAEDSKSSSTRVLYEFESRPGYYRSRRWSSERRSVPGRSLATCLYPSVEPKGMDRRVRGERTASVDAD